MAMSLSLEEFEGGELPRRANARAATIAVRIVIGEAHQVAAFEGPSSLCESSRAFFFHELTFWFDGDLPACARVRSIP